MRSLFCGVVRRLSRAQTLHYVYIVDKQLHALCLRLISITHNLNLLRGYVNGGRWCSFAAIISLKFMLPFHTRPTITCLCLSLDCRSANMRLTLCGVTEHWAVDVRCLQYSHTCLTMIIIIITIFIGSEATTSHIQSITFATWTKPDELHIFIMRRLISFNENRSKSVVRVGCWTDASVASVVFVAFVVPIPTRAF